MAWPKAVMRAVLFFLQISLILTEEKIDDGSPMLCPNSGGLLIAKLPEPVKCRPDEAKKKVELIIYKKNLALYSVPATAVYKETWRCDATCYFFGSQQQIDYGSKRVEMQELEALEVYHGLCVTPNGRNKMKNGEFSEKRDCPCWWTGTWSHQSGFCKARNGSVTTSHGGQLYSGLGPVSHCDYKKGSCQLPDKQWVFWKPNPIVNDEYIQAYKGTGFLVGTDTIVVPDLQESIVITGDCSRMTKCNTTTGYLVTYVAHPANMTQAMLHLVTHHPSLSFPEVEEMATRNFQIRDPDRLTLARKIQSDLYSLITKTILNDPRMKSYRLHPIKGNRSRRERSAPARTPPVAAELRLGAPNTSDQVNKIVSSLREEILAKLEYLSVEIQPDLNAGRLACESVALHERQLRMLAISSPTNYARAVYNNPYLDATSFNDYIGIWPCHAVLDYDFVENETACTKDPQISYRIVREEPWRQGYLELSTNIIRESSPLIKCEKRPTVLTVRNRRLYLYKGGNMKEVEMSTVKNLPGIKLANGSNFIRWNNSWVYNESDYQVYDGTNDIYSYLNEKLEELSREKPDQEETKKSQALHVPDFHLKFPWNLFGWLGFIIHYSGIVALVWLIFMNCYMARMSGGTTVVTPIYNPNLSGRREKEKEEESDPETTNPYRAIRRRQIASRSDRAGAIRRAIDKMKGGPKKSEAQAATTDVELGDMSALKKEDD
ncbi:G protein [Jeremy Point nyavirus]|uniref:G protein n=1 Tax=Jeremy Point nyavirus TaxID=2652327 RepID=A0AAE6NQH3_9MONO|nr:G protein [Jeremy Point nyavirus]QFG01732.1 G protein [Jeremy Point nyavirus]